MAKSTSSVAAFKIEASVGAGTLTDMTSYVTAIGSAKIDGNFEDTTPFGATFATQGYTGFKTGSDFTVQGFYDDTATTGPDAVFKGIGDLRNVEIDWNGSKKTTGSVLIKSYERLPKVKAFTRYTATLTWTGDIVEV